MNILVTRPKHQAKSLCHLLEQNDFKAVNFPTLEIVGLNNQKIEQQFNATKPYQWFIFISSNAVNFALKANDGKIDYFQRGSIAAVGKSTAKALSLAGLTVDLIPDTHFNTEGLLATAEMNQVEDKNCLIVRGQGGRESLAQQLQERGARVEYMEVYAREIPLCNNTCVSDMLVQGELDAITITSGDALKHLLLMIDKKLQPKLFLIPLIVISERIKRLAEEYEFEQIAVTDNPSDAAIIKTVKTSLLNGEYSG